MIRIKRQGKKVYPLWVQRLPKVPEEAMQGALQNARGLLLQEARKGVTKGHAAGGLNRRTGHLYRNLRTRLKHTRRRSEMHITGPFYGRVNARGAVIVPKKAPYLVFKIGNRWVKSKRVVIPARPWDVDAMKATQRQFPRYFRKEVERIMAEGAQA